MSPSETSWLRWQDEIRIEGRNELGKELIQLLVTELKPTEEISDEWDQGFDEAIQLCLALVNKLVK
mgnify:CR=1 FL=1